MSKTLSPRQAAERMDLAISTVYQYLNQDRFTGAFKDERGRWHIPEESLADLADTGTQATPPPAPPIEPGQPPTTAGRDSAGAHADVEGPKERDEPQSFAEEDDFEDDYVYDDDFEEDDLDDLYEEEEEDDEEPDEDDEEDEEEAEEDEEDELEDLYAEHDRRDEASLEELYARETLGDEDEEEGELYDQDLIDQEAILEELYALRALDEEAALEEIYARKSLREEDAVEEMDVLEAGYEEVEYEAPPQTDTKAAPAGTEERDAQAETREVPSTATVADDADRPPDAETVPKEEDVPSRQSAEATEATAASADAYAQEPAAFEEEIEPAEYMLAVEAEAALDAVQVEHTSEIGPAGDYAAETIIETGGWVEREPLEAAGDQVPALEEAKPAPPRKGPWQPVPVLVVIVGIILILVVTLARLANDRYGLFDRSTASVPTDTLAPTATTAEVTAPLAAATSPSFAPQAEGESLIVVAGFPSANADAKPHELLQRSIMDTATELGVPSVRAEVEASVLNADQQAEAEALGQSYAANMVVWGEDTGEAVIVEFIGLKEPESSVAAVPAGDGDTVSRTRLVEPGAYAGFVTSDLQAQLPFFSLFALSQSYLLEGHYANALATLEGAVSSFAPDSTLPEGLADAYVRLGWLYQINESGSQQALDAYERALQLDPEAAAALNNAGVIYDGLGDKQQALDSFEQARALYEQAGNSAGKAIALYNAGVMYEDLGDAEQALVQYEQALPMLREAGDNNTEAAALRSMGAAYDALGNRQQALYSYEQSLPLLRETHDVSGEARVLISVGDLYRNVGDAQQALANYNRALPLAMESGDTASERLTRLNIALVYRELEELDRAEEQMAAVVALDEAIGHPDLERDRQALQEIQTLRTQPDQPAPIFRRR